MLIGLDKNISIKELYQEVFNKLKANVGSIEIKNLIILDNETILSKF